MIKKILIAQIIRFLSLFISVNKSQWLISLRNGGGSAMAENALEFAIFLIRNGEKVKVLNGDKIKFLKKFNVKFNSLDYIVTCLKSGILVCENDMHNDIPGYRELSTYKVNLFHGLALKKIYNSSQFTKKIYGLNFKNLFKKFFSRFCFTREYNLIPTSNKYHQKKYIEAFDNKNVRILGQPRSDYLVNNMSNKFINKIKSKLKVNEFKKIILYMPTFRDREVVDQYQCKLCFDTIFQKYLKKNNYLLISKHHNFYINNKKYKNFVFKRLAKKNFIILTDQYFTQDLLRISDVLITDYSGIFFDFLLIQKPIIFFQYDKRKYISKNRELYFDVNNKNLKLGSSVEHVKGLIKKIDSNTMNNKKKYKIALSKFQKFQDGNSSKRIYEYIKNQIRN